MQGGLNQGLFNLLIKWAALQTKIFNWVAKSPQYLNTMENFIDRNSQRF